MVIYKTIKRHIYIPKPLIWGYDKVSKTFRSKVLDHKSSSFEKKTPFSNILAKFGQLRGMNFAEKVKRHIYTPTPFIEPITESRLYDLPFKNSSAYKKAMTDWRSERPTHRHPNSTSPKLWGWGLKMLKIWSFSMDSL